MIQKIKGIRFNVNDLMFVGYFYIGIMLNWFSMNGIDKTIYARVLGIVFVTHVFAIIIYEYRKKFRGFYRDSKKLKRKL